MGRLILTVLCLLALAWALPPLDAMPTRCLTYEEKSMQRWQTPCGDGTRATTYWNGTLKRWETAIQPAPGPRRSCSAQRDPQTKDVHVRCR